MKKEKNLNNISDEELSLISLISALDNKLEELDHNISLISKDNPKALQNNKINNQINEKIKAIENKISSLEDMIKDQATNVKMKNYKNTMPSKRGLNSSRKGYIAAENLRLKRIESIEKTLNDLVGKYENNLMGSEKISNNFIDNKTECNITNYEISSEEFYKRSRRIFFGFIFSISIIFLLIMVVTETNIFI